jgi:hypothetical protein
MAIPYSGAAREKPTMSDTSAQVAGLAALSLVNRLAIAL